MNMISIRKSIEVLHSENNIYQKNIEELSNTPAPGFLVFLSSACRDSRPPKYSVSPCYKENTARLAIRFRWLSGNGPSSLLSNFGRLPPRPEPCQRSANAGALSSPSPSSSCLCRRRRLHQACRRPQLDGQGTQERNLQPEEGGETLVRGARNERRQGFKLMVLGRSKVGVGRKGD